MLRDPKDRPLSRVEMTMPDGEVRVFEQTLADIERDGKAELGDPLPWMENPTMEWSVPRPVTISFTVKAGHEAEADDWWAALIQKGEGE